MIKKLFISFLFINFLSLESFALDKKPDIMYKKFKGTISSSPVNMDIYFYRKESGNTFEIHGTYFNENIGSYHEFEGNGDEKNINIQEKDRSNNIVATFKLKNSGFIKMNGSRHLNSTKKTSSVDLSEKYDSDEAKFIVKTLTTSPKKCLYSSKKECAVIDLQYPEMLIGKNIKIVNKLLVNKVKGYPMFSNTPYKSISNFINEETKRGGFVYQEEHIIVNFNDKNIIGFDCRSNYLPEGSPHGRGKTEYIYLDLDTGKVIKSSDIFSSNVLKEINEISEPLFREQNPSIVNDLQIPENGFKIPFDNLKLGSEGITFQFSQGEIGTYAIGEPQVFLSYARLKEYIKPNSPILKLIP